MHIKPDQAAWIEINPHSNLVTIKRPDDGIVCFVTDNPHRVQWEDHGEKGVGLSSLKQKLETLTGEKRKSSHPIHLLGGCLVQNRTDKSALWIMDLQFQFL